MGIEKLIGKTHIDFVFGRTVFDEPEKKWMACSYCESIKDYEMEPPASYEDLPVLYGSTLLEVVEKAVKYTEENF